MRPTSVSTPRKASDQKPGNPVHIIMDAILDLDPILLPSLNLPNPSPPRDKPRIAHNSLDVNEMNDTALARRRRRRRVADDKRKRAPRA